MSEHRRASRWMAEIAALARIDELCSGREPRDRRHTMNDEGRAAVRAVWALGDYAAFARATVWEVGPVVVAACGVREGQRVLDVAAGTGNVAVRAAEAGASVVACDLTTENFAAGRAIARDRGVELDWVEGDAEALPFGDGEFDVVTSSFGAMFAPDHRRVADEMLRVSKPGGAIGMASFTPEGLAADFFATLAPYMPPPPPGGLPPLLWGSEAHVRDLFGGRVRSLEMSRRSYTERAPSPEAYCDLFERTFGPVVAIRSVLAGTPDRLAEFDRAFLDFARRGSPGAGACEYPHEYPLVVARKA